MEQARVRVFGVIVGTGRRCAPSATKNVFAMPHKLLTIRCLLAIRRKSDCVASECVVGLTVFVTFTKLVADSELEVRRDRHIAEIEQAMNVAPQQHPVRQAVFSPLGVRLNVGCLENWERMLTRHCTGAISIADGEREALLTKPRPNRLRLPKPVPGNRLLLRDVKVAGTGQQLLPDALALSNGDVVALA